MHKSIINYLILLCVLVGILYFTLQHIGKISDNLPIIKDVKVITKKEIVVKGKVIVKEKQVPYVITLKEYEPNEYKFDFDKSMLPTGMTVDSVETTKKMYFLDPIRLGYSINSSQEYRSTLAYNPIAYKSLELGIVTDFKSAGVDIGIRYRNVGFMAYYQLDNVAGVGIMVKVF